MSAVDDLRTAGFSEQEISDWGNQRRMDMESAGFSPQEVDQYLTGMKRPNAIPEPLINRVVPAAVEGAKAGWGEEPFGIKPEDEPKIGGVWGEFKRDPLRTTLHAPLAVAGNAILRAGEAGVEGMFRGVNAALMAAGAVVGDSMEPMGNEAERARARRDWAQALSITAILASSHAPVAKRGPLGDQIVGHLPDAQNFTDAARAVHPGGEFRPETRQALVDLYEKQGIHPAEVAADAQTNPGVAKDLAEGRTPHAYAPQETVRMYHGGNPEGDGPLWFTSSLDYARGWASRDSSMKVWYVDIPADHPAVTPEYPEQGIKQGFTFNAELSAEIASRRKIFEAGDLNPLPSEQARTGDRIIDSVLEHPITKKNIDRPTVDRSFTVPYTAGGSTPLGDPRVFIDRSLPREMEIGGVKFDPAVPFTIHENIEQAVMDMLIKDGMDKDTAYKVAHYEFAEKAEAEWYKANGIDPVAAEAAYKPYLDAIQHDNPSDPPPDLYPKPYPHDDVAAAQAEPTKVLKPTPGEVARGRSIISRFNDAISPDGIRDAHYSENSSWPVPAQPIAERGLPAGPGGGGFGAEPPGGGTGFTWYGDVLPPQRGLPPPEGAKNQVVKRGPVLYHYDDSPAWRKAASGALRWYQENFQPESISDLALRADPLFAEYKSLDRMGRDRAIFQAESETQYWRGKSDAERFDYMDKIERGEKLSGDAGIKSDRHRAILDMAAKLEKEAGSSGYYLDEYFPHMWERPLEWRSFSASREAQVGPKWFQKERVFDYILEGLQAGLRLADTNPESLVTKRLLAGVDMVERMNLLQRLKEMGLAREAEGAPKELGYQGWTTLNAPNRSAWMLAPDVQPLWKNAVEAKGLWAHEGTAGNVFRGWMTLKNIMVPLKLGLSGFHALHVAHISFVDTMALAFNELSRGGTVEGALNYATQAFTNSLRGGTPEAKLARSEWLLPEGMRTPEGKQAVKYMTEGGFVPQISEELKIDAKRKLEEAWDKSSIMGIGYHGFRRAIEVPQKLMFETWIPNLKASAYLNAVQSLLARQPELITNDAMRKVALRTIAKQVDNRFGEMFYGNLFWDRYVKDAGIGSFLSLGWQVGGIREFGGAITHPIVRGVRALTGGETEAQSVIHAAQNRAAYSIGYVATAMLGIGMMSYMLTGEMPSGMDWIFARTGRNNPDGTPHRLTNMFYTREIPMAIKHVQEQGGNVVSGLADMLHSKMMFAPFAELLHNRDYWGNEIWSPNAPLYVKAQQYLTHLFGEQLPIAVAGAQQASKTGGQPWEMGMSFLGFGPAPAYVDKTAVQNRIAYLFRNHVTPPSRPYEGVEKAKRRGDVRTEYLLAKNRGDRAGMAEAAQKYFKAGGSIRGLNNIQNGLGTDVTMFRQLPDEDQKYIMENYPPADTARYRPYLKTHYPSMVADMMVDVQKARNSGDDATAAAIETKMQQAIMQGVKDGHITDQNRFRGLVAQQLRARYAPELSAIMAIPKRMRFQQNMSPQ